MLTLHWSVRFFFSIWALHNGQQFTLLEGKNQVCNCAYNGNQKSFPTVLIVRKVLTNDIISSQKTESIYQRWKDLLIRLVDISLKNGIKMCIFSPTPNNTYEQIFCIFEMYFTSIVVNGTTAQSVNTSLSCTQNLQEQQNNSPLTNGYVYFFSNI